MIKLKTAAPVVFVFILYIATIQLNLFCRANFVDTGKKPDIIQKMFGDVRGSVADWAFMKAEEYHHRGLPFMQAVNYHEGTSPLLSESAGEREEEPEHAAVNMKKDLFSSIYNAVKVTGDSHLSPSEEKEALPWFYLETAFDPHDIRGYVLGGYWLKRLGRLDDSVKFMKEGEKNNPNSAWIIGSVGKAYFNQHKEKEAIFYLERACNLWIEGKGINNVTNTYEESDRAVDFDMLGSLYEKEGLHEKAINIYNKLFYYEKNPVIKEKIIRLKKTLTALQ